ncbi:MAG: transketolase C-terminal domain-containing protein [Candidatus Lokiarchaeota archaeon]
MNISEIPLRDTFGDLIVQLGYKYKDIVVLDADLSSSTRTNKFSKEFPDRFFNMGIAEQNMVGTSIGLAISGKTPIVSGFSIFTTGRAWEFIRLASHDNLNIKFITTHSGFVGEDGSTHNALEDLSLMSTLPNMTVLVPSDNIELKSMLKTIFKQKGPVYMRLPRGNLINVHNNPYKFEFSKVDVVRKGNDIGLISCGYGVGFSMRNVEKLEEKYNISIKIINIPTIKPLDSQSLLEKVQNLKGLIVIEEHNIYCGFGSIISRIISTEIPIKMKFIGIENSFGESGKREKILEEYGFNFHNLSEKIVELLSY